MQPLLLALSLLLAAGIAPLQVAAAPFHLRGYPADLRTGATDAPLTPPPEIGDWHYPPEEQQQRSQLQVPKLASVDVSAGQAVFICQRQTVRVRVGTTFCTIWLLLSVYNDPVEGPAVAMEVNFANWGLMVLSSVQNTLELRKSVGQIENLSQPQYNLAGWDATYSTDIYNNATDYIRQYALSETDEPSFTTMNKYMAPQRDYAVIGTFDAAMKYVVCIDGRIKRANNTLFENETTLNTPPAGEVIFDPAHLVQHWPSQFSALKSGLLGQTLRGVVVGAWDAQARQGFELTAFAPPQSSSADAVLIRLRQFPTLANGSIATQYYGTEPSQPHTIDSATFYTSLWAYVRDVEQQWSPNGMRITLPYAERRQPDTAIGGMIQGLTTFQGLNPNYGTGYDYWSVTIAHGSSLPLTSIALDTALLEWGQFQLATDRIGYYFQNFVNDNGTINMYTWSNCPFPEGTDQRFPDGLPDYGRMLTLWYQAVNYTRNSTFEKATLPRVRAMTEYLLGLHLNATKSLPANSPLYGLIYGPAEHDTCHDQDYYISTQAWTLAGLKIMTQYFSIVDPTFSASLAQAVTIIDHQLPLALQAATVFNSTTGIPYFVSPKLGNIQTPFQTMIENTVAMYSNFRYWTETLLSLQLPMAYANALMNFRESHTGTVSGITRWSDHLDDMPSAGYGLSALYYGRLDFFHLLHYGHMANYQSPGTFHATEQLGMYSNQQYRVYLTNTSPTEERDVDYCVPSNMLPALFTKWQLVFSPITSFNQTIGLASGAPRRWYTAEGFSVVAAPTQYGIVSYNLTASSATTVSMTVEFTQTSNVSPLISVRLRGSSPGQQLVQASLSGQAEWVQQKPQNDIVVVRSTCAQDVRCQWQVTGQVSSP